MVSAFGRWAKIEYAISICETGNRARLVVVEDCGVPVARRMVARRMAAQLRVSSMLPRASAVAILALAFAFECAAVGENSQELSSSTHCMSVPSFLVC